jgi:GcrA cell cycle regulator
MSHHSLNLEDHFLTRRQLLNRLGTGLGAYALGDLMGANQVQAAGVDGTNPFGVRQPHHEPKAKRVIHFFMNGGPSQVDTFDPKPLLARDHGKPFPGTMPRIVSIGPGGFLRQGPGDQQAPIPPAPPRRLVPAKPSPEMADKTSLLDLNERICRWPLGHPGEADFHFCGVPVNPGFPYCVEHCGRAYQAQLPRGVRRPPPPMPFGGPRVR